MDTMKDVYIFKDYNLTLTHDYKSIKFGSGWGETVSLPMENGKVIRDNALIESKRIFNIAKNLTMLDIAANKEKIKQILGITEDQFKVMTDA